MESDWEMGLLSKPKMQIFLKWFDAEIGIEYDLTEDDESSLDYLVVFSVTNSEGQKARTKFESLGGVSFDEYENSLCERTQDETVK